MIADRLASFLRPQDRVRPDDPLRTWRWWPMPSLPGGIPMNVEIALQISVVWACVSAISKAISSCRWNVYQLSGRRRTHLPDDRLDYVLNVRPNPDMTAIGWREANLISDLTWGNAYNYIARDQANRIAELWPLVAERMVVRRNTSTDALEYEYHQMDGEAVVLAASEVLHFRGPSLHGFMGENIVARAAKAMALAAAAERFGLSYYGNNTIVGGVLEYPGTLPPDRYKALQDDWMEKRQGPDKAHKPLILEKGMKWVPFDTDASKSQVVEARKFQVEEICRWYGVPTHMVQSVAGAHGYGTNIEQLGIEFVRSALRPWALRLQQEVDYKLLSPRGGTRTTEIDLAPLMHGDAKTRAEAKKIMRGEGVLNANEWRETEGMNDMGSEGEVYTVPTTYTTIEGLEKSVEQIGKEPPAPLPSKSDRGAPTAGEDGQDPPGLADRSAFVALLARSLDDHARRWRARKRDIEQNAPAADLDARLASARSELRAKVGSEFSAECEAVESGADPRKVAEHRFAA